MNKKSIKKDKQNFYCEFCDYSTSIKCNYDRHISTLKHKKNKYNQSVCVNWILIITQLLTQRTPP